MTTYDETEEFERAKREISDFLSKLEQMAHRDVAAGEFFGFLRDGVHRLMESVAEVVWLVGETGQVEPIVHAGIEATGIQGTQAGIDSHNAVVAGLFAIEPPGGTSRPVPLPNKPATAALCESMPACVP